MDFLKGMRDFVRNPLGIIALFISLIYGIAGILLGSTANNLTVSERWPIIIFIVLFPILVLFTFHNLVTKHHWKLYSPGDFREDRSFVVMASDKEVKEKIDQEAIETAEQIAQMQRISPLEEKVPIEPTISDYSKEIIEVEDKVINKLESEFNTKAQRNAKLVDSYGFMNIFDAIFQTKGALTAVEIFLQESTIAGVTNAKILYLSRHVLNAQRALQQPILFMVVIVHAFNKEELTKLKEQLSKRIEKEPTNIELRFINKKELDTI